MITNAQEILKKADLSILDEDEREILSLRYDGDGNAKRTAGEVGQILNMHHATVGLTEKRALIKLADHEIITVQGISRHMTYKEYKEKAKRLEEKLGFRWGDRYLKTLPEIE